MKRMLFSLLFLFTISAHAQLKTENVILITLDGMRWQEIFSGAEKRLITDKTFVSDSARLSQKFWNDDLPKRRELLMPFFWNVIKEQGQLYGNRSLGNKVNVTNNQWFSYPGYNEILTGAADNERIHSNDKFDNPNQNVLEFLNKQKGFVGKVAAYSSWDVFPYILNAKRSGVPVNAGIVEAKNNPNEFEKFLNELMFQVPNPLGDVRLDAFTFHYAMEYLKKERPRVLYIALDETDDFAHGGKYDLYLEAAHYIDGLVKQLWDYVQNTEGYKGKTTLILTCDHGRGDIDKEDWRNHGAKVMNADQIWIAILGPDTSATGEVKTAGQLYQNQLARTIATFLGVRFVQDKPTGEPISAAFK